MTRLTACAYAISGVVTFCWLLVTCCLSSWLARYLTVMRHQTSASCTQATCDHVLQFLTTRHFHTLHVNVARLRAAAPIPNHPESFLMVCTMMPGRAIHDMHVHAHVLMEAHDSCNSCGVCRAECLDNRISFIFRTLHTRISIQTALQGLRQRPIRLDF